MEKAKHARLRMSPTSSVKKVFVAATGQDQGKTTVFLGLMAAFNKACPPMHSLKVKIQPADAAKTTLASKLVREYVDLHHILDRI
jgi:cobyrinic acid a,c-diamide synthase